jgi:flagellar FliL protein
LLVPDLRILRFIGNRLWLTLRTKHLPLRRRNPAAPWAPSWDKDGKITAIVPVAPAAGGHGEGGEGGKQSLYFAIDPPLVVNFEDGSVVRFLQISMEIAAHDQKALDSVQKNIPLIRNNLLLLMSNRNYQSMMSREGKEKLRQEALTEIRAVQKKAGGGDVDDVLFTSFVVQ